MQQLPPPQTYPVVPVDTQTLPPQLNVPQPTTERPDAGAFAILEDISEAQEDFRGNSFIPHHITTELFNKAFGLGWSLECRERWIDKSPFDHIYNVTLRLTVPGGTFKEHTGYESFKNHCVKSAAQKKMMRDLITQDVIVNNLGDVWKVAWSSAIRKVSSLYGIGLAFYRNMYRNQNQQYAPTQPQGYQQYAPAQPQGFYQPTYQANSQFPPYQPGR